MKRCLSATVLCLLVSVAAWAQPPQEGAFSDRPEGPGGPGDFQGPGPMGRPPNLMFEAIDADGDGVITIREMRKAVVALKSLDTNGDGNLTLEEVSPRGGPGGPGGGPGGDPNAMLDRIFQNDTNHDGVLSPNEVNERMAPMLQGADTNNDGKLDRAEVTAAMEKARGRFGPGGGMGFEQQQMMQEMMQADRNGDGKLTPDEVSPRARAMLRGADTNGDGAIDAQELQAASQRMSERFGRGGRGYGPPTPQGNPNGAGQPQQQ